MSEARRTPRKRRSSPPVESAVERAVQDELEHLLHGKRTRDLSVLLRLVRLAQEHEQAVDLMRVRASEVFESSQEGSETRVRALRMLALCKSDGISAELRTALRGTRLQLRATAMDDLLERDELTAEDVDWALEDLLDHPMECGDERPDWVADYFGVLQSAIRILRPPKAVQRLEAVFARQGRSPYLASRALDLLVTTRDDHAVAHVDSWLGSTSSVLRELACWTLFQMPWELARPRLLRALEDPCLEVSQAAVEQWPDVTDEPLPRIDLAARAPRQPHELDPFELRKLMGVVPPSPELAAQAVAQLDGADLQSTDPAYVNELRPLFDVVVALPDGRELLTAMLNRPCSQAVADCVMARIDDSGAWYWQDLVQSDEEPELN